MLLVYQKYAFAKRTYEVGDSVLLVSVVNDEKMGSWMKCSTHHSSTGPTQRVQHYSIAALNVNPAGQSIRGDITTANDDHRPKLSGTGFVSRISTTMLTRAFDIAILQIFISRHKGSQTI